MPLQQEPMVQVAMGGSPAMTLRVKAMAPSAQAVRRTFLFSFFIYFANVWLSLCSFKQLAYTGVAKIPQHISIILAAHVGGYHGG
jgi:hypothetical protein